MLDGRLTVKTYGEADERNLIFWRNYRVTVLDQRLFRIERSDARIWRDNATQSVFYRNAERQNFIAEETDGDIKITTGSVALVLKSDLKDCYVILNGEKVPLDNSGNLLGTYRTLDCCDGDTVYENWFYGCAAVGKVKLGDGVCSKSGVAVIHDENSLSLDGSGKVFAERGNGEDIYVFAFGNDYRGAVNALYKITGAPPMLPRFALGNWWSRYHAYTADEYLTLLDKFSQRDIPLTVATVDMDWHWTDIEKQFGITEKGRNADYYGGNNGWTGYSWNRTLFPDYRSFLKQVNARNMKVTLNVHPADGVRWFEDMYGRTAVACGVAPETCKRVEFDLTDDNFVNTYFSVIHAPYENDGVAFWWLDWQQGETSKMEGLDPLWSLNHYHFLDNAKNGNKGLILSRYCGVGAHRYPVGFSGDTYATWKTLEYLPYFTATASNVGYTWWSHDIGGHMWGQTDGELYLRFVQFGVFSPINRLHCCGLKAVTKEPWFFGNGTGYIAEQFLKFRHRLIPFLYTANYLTHTCGRALVEPLYYEYADENAYRYNKDEYLFGGLLVAPVTSPLKDDGFARVNVRLPQGRYTDIFTKEEYFIEAPEGSEGVLLRKLESIPVLAKAGTVLPLSLDKGNSVKNPEKLEIKVYSGNGSYTLYEDDENGGEYFTDFDLTESNGEVVLTVSGRGDYGIIPSNRTLKISFENIYCGNAEVYFGGKRVDCGKEYFENLTVTVNYEHGKEICVVAKDSKTAFENTLYRMEKIMIEAEENVFLKDKWYNEFIKAENEEKLKELIVNSELKEVTKTKLKEIFF